jgi:suppressor for copper-sensitivity B
VPHPVHALVLALKRRAGDEAAGLRSRKRFEDGGGSRYIGAVMSWLRFCVLVFVVLALARPAVASGGASEWVETEQSAVRLIAASETAGDSGELALGLQIRLAQGWKTYWRSPGDAGYPARIDWTGSENLAAADMAWPAPERFSVLGLETIGYGADVVLPLTVRPVTAGDGVALRAAVDYLICDDICIPQHADLVLDLPAGPARPSEFAHLIARFASRVPSQDLGAELAVVAAEASGGAAQPVLAIHARSAVPFVAPDVFVEGPDGLMFGAPHASLTDDGREAILTVPISGTEYFSGPLVASPVTVTLVDGGRAIEQRLIIGEARGGADFSGAGLLAGQDGGMLHAPGALSWVAILGLALLGGLILNLMPCVLPVLSIKLLGVVGHGGGDVARVRLSFLASAAGILCSFLVLGGALAIVKAMGAMVGWGMQFQQPWFLIAMTLIVTVFAANLFGLFEVRLPRLIADAGERAGHVGGLGGHFLTGALATLLATPCSAPFLGTAVGFALARGTPEIMAVLLAVGVGLAAPYLAVALFPQVATRLPRPGPWMIVLRRVLGFALAVTALWLVSVLAVQIGAPAAIAIGALAAATAGAIALGVRVAKPGPARAAAAAALALAVVSFLVPQRPDGSGERDIAGLWQTFDEKSIPELVTSGHVVLVNVTADWCITCKVNETLVLSRGDVRASLAAGGVVAMQGDWTRPNAAIASYLARFGRYGIPFDAVYGPGLPEGEALPELLTADIVKAALERAAAAQ